MNKTSFCRNSMQDSMTKETSAANIAQMFGLKVSSHKGSSWSFGSNGCNNYGYEDSTPLGFSWPPRSYACSFCKREFRSAQALGGHMNVHRRDRARLRQYSPPSETCGDCNDDNCNSHNGNVPSLNSNNVEPKPNPSLSSNPISYHTKSPTFASSLPLIYPAISSQFKKRGGYNEGFNKLITKDLIEKKAASNGHVEGENFNASVHEKECEKRDFVRLDLEIGLINHHQYKEELDLELRLGYI